MDPQASTSRSLRNCATPAHDITVFERNKPDDTFGWGVVLSGRDPREPRHERPPSAPKSIGENFAYWDDIAVHKDGQTMLSTGHGFCGIGRKQLLILLQERACELGITLKFQSEEDADTLAKTHDLVIASDGAEFRHPQDA